MTSPARTGPTGPGSTLSPARRPLSLAPPGGRPHGARLGLAALGFAVYVGSVARANWMISHVGRPAPGAHVLPVGFGLEAPSGVYLAGLTFVARDIVQRLAGLRIGVVAIVIGATLRGGSPSPAIAVASGVTFLLSESCDFLVYTPLQARRLPLCRGRLRAGGRRSRLHRVPDAGGDPAGDRALRANWWARRGSSCSAGWWPVSCAVRPVQEPGVTPASQPGPRRVPQAGTSPPTDRGRAAVPAAPLRPGCAAASTDVSSPAFRRPFPTSTSIPTIERTIWWQNEVASISKHRREAPRSDHSARSTRRTRGPGRSRLNCPYSVAERGEIMFSQQHIAGGLHAADLERLTYVPGGSGGERIGPLRTQQVVAVQAG